MGIWLTNFSNWMQPSESDIPRIVPLAIFFCILFFLEGLYLLCSKVQRLKAIND